MKGEESIRVALIPAIPHLAAGLREREQGLTVGMLPHRLPAGLRRQVVRSAHSFEDVLATPPQEEEPEYSMEYRQEQQAHDVTVLAFDIELKLLQDAIAVHREWRQSVYGHFEGERCPGIVELVHDKCFVSVLQEGQVRNPSAPCGQITSVHQKAPEEAQNQNRKASDVVRHPVGRRSCTDRHAHQCGSHVGEDENHQKVRQAKCAVLVQANHPVREEAKEAGRENPHRQDVEQHHRGVVRRCPVNQGCSLPHEQHVLIPPDGDGAQAHQGEVHENEEKATHSVLDSRRIRAHMPVAHSDHDGEQHRADQIEEDEKGVPVHVPEEPNGKSF
mmetsp:Transcript_13070/g.36687  ORF Transcript_13070/g.36687 Transcript_13070/m.36687 type:complete len:331 (-) Transcript_13070:1024-2016(-)